MRFATALVLLVALAAGVPRLLEPATWRLAQAVRDLGPISGWRCAQNPTYVYDPRRVGPDSALLAEAPEDVVRQQAPGVRVERVEANLRGGDTVVWTRVRAADGTLERRVYVLNPGVVQTIVLGSAPDQPTICTSHLGNWRIVDQHTLG